LTVAPHRGEQRERHLARVIARKAQVLIPFDLTSRCSGDEGREIEIPSASATPDVHDVAWAHELSKLPGPSAVFFMRDKRSLKLDIAKRTPC
jgi:hypothetical protein